MPGLQVAVRVGGAGERVLGVDDRFDQAALDERPDLALERARDGAFLRRRPRPQRRSRNSQPLLQHRAQIERGLRAAGELGISVFGGFIVNNGYTARSFKQLVRF